MSEELTSHQIETEIMESFSSEKEKIDWVKAGSHLTEEGEENSVKLSDPILPKESGVSPQKSNVNKILTPKKETEIDSSMKTHSPKSRINYENLLTPTKGDKGSSETVNSDVKEVISGDKLNENKTPEKSTESINGIISHKKTEEQSLGKADIEGGMLTEIEQAKLLMAASEEFLKSVQKTPVKQNNSQATSPQQLSKYSPGTPGRHKRVELITLASPKAKKLRQF